MLDIINMKLILYSGPHCGLCEQAKALIDNIDLTSIDVQVKNVRDSAELYHLYGARIPVLVDIERESELAWPFDEQSLREWLA